MSSHQVHPFEELSFTLLTQVRERLATEATLLLQRLRGHKVGRDEPLHQGYASSANEGSRCGLVVLEGCSLEHCMALSGELEMYVQEQMGSMDTNLLLMLREADLYMLESKQAALVQGLCDKLLDAVRPPFITLTLTLAPSLLVLRDADLYPAPPCVARRHLPPALLRCLPRGVQVPEPCMEGEARGGGGSGEEDSDHSKLLQREVKTFVGDFVQMLRSKYWQTPLSSQHRTPAELVPHRSLGAQATEGVCCYSPREPRLGSNE
jgi:hypothetical protein